MEIADVSSKKDDGSLARRNSISDNLKTSASGNVDKDWFI
jgi:hypothetical protein